MGYRPLRNQYLVKANSPWSITYTTLSLKRLPDYLPTNKLYFAAPTTVPVFILTAIVFPFLTTMTANIICYLVIHLPPISDDVILAPSAYTQAATKGYI